MSYCKEPCRFNGEYFNERFSSYDDEYDYERRGHYDNQVRIKKCRCERYYSPYIVHWCREPLMIGRSVYRERHSCCYEKCDHHRCGYYR